MGDKPNEPLSAGTNGRDTGKPAPSTSTHRMQQMLAQLWRKNEGTLHQRVELIRRSHELLLQDQLDDQTRLDAHGAAHKLAGILGSFGLPRGTDLAREAELMLNEPEQLTARSAARLESLLAEMECLVAAKSRELQQADLS